MAILSYYIDLFGCAKNQVDAEIVMAFLNKSGWQSKDEAEEADIIIVYSCGFIESAKKESINAVLSWRRIYPEKKIFLAGCLAQRYKKELTESLPEADGIFGINTAEIINSINSFFNRSGGNKKTRTGDRPLLSMPGSAFVKISDGCDNRCSYCAIPLIRGSLKCRAIPDIARECKTLLKRGIKEICIVGQDIGSYGKLPELLNAILKLQGHFWIRLLYIHPDHFPYGILDIMEKDERLIPYFDIPFQHASKKILSAMNRHGDSEKYIKLINTIRTRLPRAVIRSTFLLGFPGETDEDFNLLLDFQQKAQLDWLGCFVYSREEGTDAYSMKGQVPKKTALVRRKKIEEMQVPITERRMDRFISQERIVLIEEQVGDFWLGRLYCHAPEIDGAAVITGADDVIPYSFIPCKITARRGIDLEAEIKTPVHE